MAMIKWRNGRDHGIMERDDVECSTHGKEKKCRSGLNDGGGPGDNQLNARKEKFEDLIERMHG